MFSGLIDGNLTLITVVVSINQLLLGREFKSPGTLESQIERSTLTTQHQQLRIPLAIGVSFVPLALLFAFILRTATVTQRTSATLPFTIPQQEHRR